MTRRIVSDVAIVGGGLIGCWAALFLRRRGRGVVLLEKGEIGAQSSGQNFGNLRIQGRHVSEFPLALRAAGQWEQLADLIGDNCGFTQTGHLYVARDAEQERKLGQIAAEANVNGLAVELLDRAALRRRWPCFGVTVVAGCWSTRDATANPRRVTPATARAAAELDAELLPGTRVIGVTHVGGRFIVETDRGVSVECKVLVNAAGAWGGDIAAAFGQSAPLFVAGPPQFVTDPQPHLLEPSVQAADGSVIFRQTVRGNVIVAGYPRTATDRERPYAPVPPGKTLAAMGALAGMVPALAQAAVIRVWSGTEGYLPDMLPVLGPSRAVPGLFHAFGFSGHGFQLGPGVGLVLSELIVDGCSPTPLPGFGIERFEGSVEPDEKFRREFDAHRPAGSPSEAGS